MFPEKKVHELANRESNRQTDSDFQDQEAGFLTLAP